MRISITVIVALTAGVVGGLLANWPTIYPAAHAQDYSKKYECLSDYYNSLYSPILAEWYALSLSARFNNESGLTNKIARTSFTVHLLPEGMKLGVNTNTQPSWNTYLGNSRFSVSDREVRAAYEEAAREVLLIIRSLFPERISGLEDTEIEISFFIRGTRLGHVAERTCNPRRRVLTRAA